MFCKKCGKKLVEDARFCNMCGSFIDVNATKEEEKKVAEEPVVTEAPVVASKPEVVSDPVATAEAEQPKIVETEPSKVEVAPPDETEPPKVEAVSVEVEATPAEVEEPKEAEVPVKNEEPEAVKVQPVSAPVMVDSPELIEKVDAIQTQLTAIQNSLENISKQISTMVTKEEYQSKCEDIKNSIDGLSDVVKQKENKFKEVIKQMLD